MRTERGKNISPRPATVFLLCALIALVELAATASADDRIYFSAIDDVTDVLVQSINAETVRIDIASWYLSEHSISIAVANRFAAGVPVRIIGDRAALFENDPHTKNEFYWLASQGIPIRLRFNPTWFPEIDRWKAAIFVGQNLVEFGSGNFAPTELRPDSPTNYDDETELFTTDPDIVNAFRTKFDVMWNDTTREPNSIIAGPPYLKDWDDACRSEPTGGCNDYWTRYPSPAPMLVDTTRLEPDNPMAPDLIWGQGAAFNARLTQEILSERGQLDIVVYRLEVDGITQALLDRYAAGVRVRVLVDPGRRSTSSSSGTGSSANRSRRAAATTCRTRSPTRPTRTCRRTAPRSATCSSSSGSGSAHVARPTRHVDDGDLQIHASD